AAHPAGGRADLGRVRRDRRRPGAPGRGRPARRLRRHAAARRRRAGDGGGHQGALPGPAAVVAPRRARRRARRHRLRRHGRRRLRLHGEHPLPGRGLQRHRRRGPRRHRRTDRHLRRAGPVQPVRAPPLHRLHRHRRRSGGRQPDQPGALAAAAAGIRRRRAEPRHVELRHAGRHRQLRDGLPHPDGAGARGGRGVRPVATPRRAAGAHRGAPRRRAARSAAGHRHPLAGRARRPARGPRARPATRWWAGGASHARLPAGRRRAGLPAPSVPSWYAAARLRGARTAARRAAHRRSPLHLLPRTGGTHPM
ncbi:MAG: putative membrane protein, partial [uncultured Nocardioides sp.]